MGDGTLKAQIAFGIGDSSGVGSGGIVIADFNGDGNLDLAAVNPGNDTISVLIGNGNSTFAPQVVYSTGFKVIARALALGDFNGDGVQDLAIVGSSSAMTVLTGRGDGKFF